MCARILTLLTILQMFSSIKGAENTVDEKRVVCYYGALRSKQLKNLNPEDMDASLCTHIVYVHGEINTLHEEVMITPGYDEYPTGGLSYSKRLVKLKEANPNLKLLLLLSTDKVAWVQETAERSAKIIQSAVSFLNATRFDGFHFVPPGTDQTEDDATFICKIHSELDKYGYMVTYLSREFPESKSQDLLEKIYRCSSFTTLLLEEWATKVNTTRFLGSLSLAKTWVDKYIENGFPANKLVIPISTFGLILSLTDPKQTGLGASVKGPGTDATELSDGYTISYRQLLKRLSDTTEGWTIIRDEESKSPYAYSKTGVWVSYDDATSAATKAHYFLERNVGGVLLFFMDMDDFEGTTGKTFPIIRAVSDTFKQGARANNVSQ